MPEPDGLPPLREVIARHDLRARKSLGQNFLLDLNLTDRIVRAACVDADSHVIEIGPGPGGLTRSLLAHGARVYAIERDRRCQQALADIAQAYPERLTVIAGDALEMDVSDLCPAPRQIVANLPYNIATPLLLGWLKKISAFERLTLMFQSEVADRLLALPGSKDYGRLSVITQWLCHVERAFNVHKAAFTPSPKVTSTVVHLNPRPSPLAPARWSDLERVTKAAFGQRRKMLRTALKGLSLKPEKAGIDPSLRAEALSIEDFCALARLLAKEEF